MAKILYKKLIRQKSTNGGLTWTDLEPKTYKVGDIIENPSNCKSEETKFCRWTAYPNTTYRCEGTNKYQLLFRECTEDGEIWNKTGEEKIGNLIDIDSTDCGGSGGDIVITNSYVGDGVCHDEKRTVIQIKAVGKNEKTFTYDNKTNGVASLNIDKEYAPLDTITSFIINTKYDKIEKLPYLPNLTKGKIIGAYLESIDLESITLENLIDLSDFLNENYTLRTIDVSKLKTEDVTLCTLFLSGCHSLSRIYGLENLNLEKCNERLPIFEDCYYLRHLEMPPINNDKKKSITLSPHDWRLESVVMKNYKKLELRAAAIPSLKKIDLSGCSFGWGGIGEGLDNLKYIILNDVTLEDFVHIRNQVIEEGYSDRVTLYSNMGYEGATAGMPPIEPISYWHKKGEICEGGSKYELLYEEKSTDGGYTWVKTGAEKKGMLIDKLCEDCGYVRPKSDILEFYFEPTEYFSCKFTIYDYFDESHPKETVIYPEKSPYRVDVRKDLGLKGDFAIYFPLDGNDSNETITRITSLPSEASVRFGIMPKLKELNINNIAYQFKKNCPFNWNNFSAIEKVDMSHMCSYYWRFTEGVHPLELLFKGCSAIQEIDASTITLNHCEDSYHLESFLGCSSLRTLNLTNWSFNNLMQPSYMFAGCTSLKTIIFKNGDDYDYDYIVRSLKQSGIPDGQVTIIR